MNLFFTKRLRITILPCLLILTFFCNTSFANSNNNSINFIPANAQILLQVNATDNLLKIINEKEPAFYQEFNAALQKTLGINLFLTNLNDLGIDTKKQMGFFISDLVLGKSLTLVSYLPVRSAPQTIQKIVEIIRQKSPDIELKTEGKAQTIEFGAGLKTFFVQKNQLLYIINQINSNAQPVIDTILRGNSSLVKSSRFKDVAEKLDIYKDIFLYVDSQSLLSKNKEYFGGEKAKFLSGWNITAYDSMGIAFNCTTKDFVSQYVLTVNEKYQHWLKLFKNSSFNKDFLLKQSDFPGFALSVAINPTRLYMNLKEFLSAQDYQTFLQMKSLIKNQLNIELEELVNLFDGNFHYIIPAKITLEEAVKSSVMAFGINDERDTMTMLDRIIDKSMSPMQKKMLIQKGNTYILPDMQIGFKDNNLIITYNKNVLNQVMDNNSSRSFMNKLKDQELKKMLKADAMIFFLSGALFRNKLNKINLLQNNDLEGYGNLVKVLLPKLNYLLYSFALDDDALIGNLIIKTQFEKPFFQEVLPEFVKVLKNSAENGKTQANQTGKTIDKGERQKLKQKIIGKWNCKSMGEVLPQSGMNIPAAFTFSENGEFTWSYMKNGEKIEIGGKYFLIVDAEVPQKIDFNQEYIVENKHKILKYDHFTGIIAMDKNGELKTIFYHPAFLPRAEEFRSDDTQIYERVDLN